VVCVCLSVRVYAFVRARVFVRVRVSICVCACLCVYVCMRAYVCKEAADRHVIKTYCDVEWESALFRFSRLAFSLELRPSYRFSLKT
jgi:hypothetical protein